MSKNAEGWIRHRGGKCPVDSGVKVDYRMRDGEIDCFGHDAGRLHWSHEPDDCDIMAYRLHKPVEQPVIEPAVVAKLRYDPCADGPLQWRDRITEIDATTSALAAERAELVQKLASEGFALIERAVDPVEDYGNIQIGDLVSVISIGGFSDCTGLSVGDIVEVTSVDNDESLKTVSGGSWGSIGYNYKFHSRPSA